VTSRAQTELVAEKADALLGHVEVPHKSGLTPTGIPADDQESLLEPRLIRPRKTVRKPACQ